MIYPEIRKPEGGSLVKLWTKNLPVEEAALDQIRNMASLPFIHKHIAIMPDVHWGMGATVGSVIPTSGAIVPAAVGVDIGCGMVAHKTTLRASELPDNLKKIRLAIEGAVPHGRTNDGKGTKDEGSWRGKIPVVVKNQWPKLQTEYDTIVEKHPFIGKWGDPANHLGTLGTGNHFIEVCLDQDDMVWLMLHSGSRGIGNRIGRYFIEKAKEDMKRYFINLPDANLSYLVDGSENFTDYVQALNWAQEFARINRKIMMTRTIFAVIRETNKRFGADEVAVNCHHNYVSRENHFGKNVWVTRKGAVRARAGDLGIIPGSMGAKSYIVEGLGNPDSFMSCSHGAGRAMSRRAAKDRFTLDDHIKATEGVECRKDEDVIDETPMAYKDIDAVMEAQKDLVKVLYTLRQVVCVKG